MEYRSLGRTGKQVSLLSLGCMRLPENDDEGAKVVRRAAELGINYFETSNWYCDSRSEIKVGMGLKGLRDKVFISTKLKIGPAVTGDDVRRAFEDSLKRLEVDRVDFYQLWDFRWDDHEAVMKKGGGLDTIEALRDEGLIGHIGMTSHESNEHVIELLDTGRLESVTLSYHLLNREVEPVIEYAGERGIGVVIMTPLAGGLLATPSDVLAEMVGAQNTSNAAGALRFVMSNPHVSTVPSGMTTVAEVEENVRTWADFKALSAQELTDLAVRLDEYSALGKQFCTACNYCMPCPSGVKIPKLFGIRNRYTIFGLQDSATRSYHRMTEGLPDACNECGECEVKCPNGIPIISQLKEVAEMFGPTPARMGEPTPARMGEGVRD